MLPYGIHFHAIRVAHECNRLLRHDRVSGPRKDVGQSVRNATILGVEGIVVAVSASATHSFVKPIKSSIRLLAGFGVEGDAHAGKTDQHESHKRADPERLNLRQVHLIHSELHDELNANGFSVKPGEMGENVTTRGLDLLNLPTGSRLHLGDEAVIEITGLRNPCAQLEQIQEGLLAAVVEKEPDGTVIRKSGVMSVVLKGGEVHAGDRIRVELPAEPFKPLVCV